MSLSAPLPYFISIRVFEWVIISLRFACLSVQAITFEQLKLGTLFLVYRYILAISRLSLSIKGIGQDQSQMNKMSYFT